MLLEVARADYNEDVDAHLAPLKRFRDTREVPLLDWTPREVLDLIRWSQPDDPNWGPEGHGTNGHLMRAFACATLFKAYEREENRCRIDDGSFNETAIQLVDSLRVLSGDLVPAGMRFFAWCVAHLGPLHEDRFERTFLELALLALALNVPAISDGAIVALCKFIDNEVQSLLPEMQWYATRDRDWLLSMNIHDLRNSRWIELGREFYQWAESQPESDKSTWVALIGRSLAEEYSRPIST
jgi:hypothetical protein